MGACRSPRGRGAAVGSGRTKGSFTQYGIAESVRGSLADRPNPADLYRQSCQWRLSSGARHVHIGSYFLQPRLAPQSPPFLEILRAEGITVSVDPNWDPSGAWYGGLQSLLEQVDVFFPNAAEARALTGVVGTADAAIRWAQKAAVVAVKDGDNGGLVAIGETLVHQPTFPVVCADTTGAGDAFDAGFLKGWLSNLPMGQCLAYACAAGALTTRTIGATGSQPDYEEVVALVGRTEPGDPPL